MRRPFLLLAFLLIALGAEAAVTKHKEWLQSPEAYFATDAERKQWRSIDSDDAAEAFLAKFRQRPLGGAGRAVPRTSASQPDPHDRVVTLTFGGDSHPAFAGEDFVIHFDVDSGSGKDRPAKGTDQKRLDALMEAAIAASIVEP